MRRVWIAAILGVAAAAAVAAPLARDRALAVMAQRHEGMETIGKANKAINRELGGSSPNLTIVHAGAAQIADLARKAPAWFPAGTGPDIGKTGAKPEIWQDPKDFAAKLSAFQKAAQAFNLASSSSDLTSIHARFTELGQACKACHDKYRAEMKH
jgi:cytochrome c556